MTEEVKFSVVVNLFTRIQKSRTSAKKRSKFRNFLDTFCKPPNYFSAMRLILPSLDQERGAYGLKETVLALCLIDALGMSRDSPDVLRLINWQKGDANNGVKARNFALVAAEVLQRRQGTDSGGLTIKELNDLLDRLASAKNRSEKTAVLHTLINKTNAQEMKWVIMIVLKDLKLGISAKNIFQEFHSDAECDLKLVCENLSDLSQRDKRQYILIQQTTHRMEKFGMDEQKKVDIENHFKISNLNRTTPVIGIVDSGVNINHDSFHDRDMTDINDDHEWNGGIINVPYKRKVLAVKSSIPTTNPRETSNLDVIGHGTMCASIAASSRLNLKFLEGVEGITSTTISGANPDARIASYKVYGTELNLEGNLCMQIKPEELLDAIQQAVKDKVDVLTISLAGQMTNERSYLEDMLNRGAFCAFKENIVVCLSAGNYGNDGRVVNSLAPWVVTVGSCNSGGRFFTNIELGNGMKLKGFGAFMDKDGEHHEIFFCPKCYEVNEPPGMYKHVIACKNINCSMIKRAAGILVLGIKIGTCFVNNFRKPIVFLNPTDGAQVYHYINTRKLKMVPTVKILKSAYEESNELCRVSITSGRVSNPYDAYLLKPDICAPGENLLCAANWDPTHLYGDYMIANGTSAATPMVAGMVSYIRTIHPKWEPGRIKSAIMTTAIPLQDDNEEDIMGFGAGRINPLKAVDPGLVYDLSWDECRRYLLGREPDKRILMKLEENLGGQAITSENLNLPSFSLVLRDKTTFNRTITNVGPKENCTYNANFEFGSICSSFIHFCVEPTTLIFNGIGEKKHFRVTIDSSDLSKESKMMMVAYARLVWTEDADEPHIVSSPIVMRVPDFGMKKGVQPYMTQDPEHERKRKRTIES